MAIQITPQLDRGGQIGDAFGKGIKKHLSQLSENKALDIKADRLSKATGMTAEEAQWITHALRPEDQWKAIEAYGAGRAQIGQENQQTFDNRQQELQGNLSQAQQPLPNQVPYAPEYNGPRQPEYGGRQQQAREANIGQAQQELGTHNQRGPEKPSFIEAVGRGTPSANKEEVALRKKGIDESHKWNKEIRKTHESASNYRKSAERALATFNKGKIRTGIVQQFLSGNNALRSQLNADEQLFVKEINEMISQKVQTGKGVPTARRIALEEASKPDLGLKPEAIRKIFQTAIQTAKDAEKPYIEAQRIIKANNGRVPENLENQTLESLGILDSSNPGQEQTSQAASNSYNPDMANQLPDGTQIFDDSGKLTAVIRGGKEVPA